MASASAATNTAKNIVNPRFILYISLPIKHIFAHGYRMWRAADIRPAHAHIHVRFVGIGIAAAAHRRGDLHCPRKRGRNDSVWVEVCGIRVEAGSAVIIEYRTPTPNGRADGGCDWFIIGRVKV